MKRNPEKGRLKLFQRLKESRTYPLCMAVQLQDVRVSAHIHLKYTSHSSGGWCVLVGSEEVYIDYRAAAVLVCPRPTWTMDMDMSVSG